MTDRVNKNEYSRRRGVSRQAVYAAIRTGKITGAVGVDGKIDVALADKLWASNTNPTVGHHGHLKRTKRKDPEQVIEAAKKIGIDPNAVPTLIESKTIEAAYKAKLAQLEYEEKTAKLIDIDKVKKEAFRLARITRDAMIAIPDRIAAEIAGMTDPFAIHRKLTDEIRNAISEISASE